MNGDKVPRGKNWYAYANADPLLSADPSGQFGLLGAVIGGVVGGIANGTVAYFTGDDVKAAIVGGVVGGALVGSGAGLIAGAVELGTTSAGGALGAGAVLGAGGGVVGNTVEQLAQGKELYEISLREQLIAGAAGAIGGVAGASATVFNRWLGSSASAVNSTLQNNLNLYSRALIAEDASDATIRQVQNSIVGGMTRAGYSTATVTAGVSAADNFVFPFVEEILEEIIKATAPDSTYLRRNFGRPK